MDNRGSAGYAAIAMIFLILIMFILLEYNHGMTIYKTVQKELEQAVSAAVLLSIDDEYRKDEILFISDIPAAKARCVQCIVEDMGLDHQFRKMNGNLVVYSLSEPQIEVTEAPPYLICYAYLHIPLMMVPDGISPDAEITLHLKAAAHAKSLLN